MKKIKNQEIWAAAKKRHRFSVDVIQMAKALGLNPKKFGSIDTHKQETWKEPLPDFIRTLYYKRFKKVPG
jgi:hypothetical protein